MGRALDDRPEDQPQASDREQGAGRVGGPRVLTSRLGNQQQGPRQAGRDHRDVDQEDRSPPEVLEQRATRHRPNGDAEPDRPGPHANRPGPRMGIAEDVIDDGQARRDHHRRTGPHQPPPDDEGIDASREGGTERAAPEDDQAADEEPLAPVAVGQAAGDEQQAPEHHRVGVDDPLELVGGGLQLLHQGGQGHVQDGVVEVDHQHGDAEDRERRPRVAPACRARGGGAGRRPRPQGRGC